MSGNNYGYYYTQPTSSYPKQWSEWTIEQQQYNHANFIRNTTYETTPVVHTAHSNTHAPQRAPYYNNYDGYSQSNNRNYQAPRRHNNRNRSANYKRPRLDSDDTSEPKSKSLKKKKKPISQIMPSKKDWTMEEAELALNCEKEYNKRHKNQCLIIKFPDLELNKDMVSKFHNAIQNVHFQQPSTARFCFVTVDESVEPNSVISALNKIKFGEGFLRAEYKKDREDDQNLGPEDIDPHTLYVGNLAQEITKEDMVKTYPKSKRIDIGYAKKMKYTRYAFVTFKSVIDSVEAFKNTHSTQMYSKSLIVRFRRLHGTVGMPGESKPQNPPKNKEATEETSVEERTITEHHVPNSKENDEGGGVAAVKQEPESSGEEEHFDVEIATISTDSGGSLHHKPLIKSEVKVEPVKEDVKRSRREVNTVVVIPKFPFKLETDEMVKPEPNDTVELYNIRESSEEETEEKESFNADMYFRKLYSNMIVQAGNVSKESP